MRANAGPSSRPAVGCFSRLSEPSFRLGTRYAQGVLRANHNTSFRCSSGPSFPVPTVTPLSASQVGSFPNHQALLFRPAPGTPYGILGASISVRFVVHAYQNRMFWHTSFSHFGALSSMVTDTPRQEAKSSPLAIKYHYTPVLILKQYCSTIEL